MRLLVVGATGRVGRRVVAEALAHGYDVTALARDPSGLPDSVRTVAGDVRDREVVDTALEGCEAVVSALGTPPGAPVDDTLSAGVETVLDGMAERDVDRIVVVAAAGVLDGDGGLRMDAPDFPPFLREVAERHRAVYETLRERDVAWTLVCPPGMPDGEARGARVDPDRLPAGGREVTTGDVAAFALRALEEGLTGRYGIAD